MIKRVLLLAVLVAVLVVPGAAYVDFRDDFSEGVDGSWIHYSSGGTNAVTDGVLKFGTVGGSLKQRYNYYIYPTGLQASFTVNFKVDTTSTSLLPYPSHQSFGLVTSTANPEYTRWPDHFAGGYHWRPSRGDILYTVEVDADGATRVLKDGVVAHTLTLNPAASYYACLGAHAWHTVSAISYVDYVEVDPAPPVTDGELCIVRIKDAVSGEPLAGEWHLNILGGGGGGMLVDKDVLGDSTTVMLPQTRIFQGHWLHIEKEGYDQIPAQLMFDVPYGGREIVVRLTPTAGTATDGKSIVTFTVTDIELGSPVSGALVNVEGEGKFTGNEGITWYELAENATYEWIASSPNHYTVGGNFTLGADDLAIPVSLTRKTSDLPRPPLPDLPGFPVIHPSLDPAGFRMKIQNVPVLGGLASPFLDPMDAIAVGLDDIARPILEFPTAPADSVVRVLEGVGVCTNETSTRRSLSSSETAADPITRSPGPFHALRDTRRACRSRVIDPALVYCVMLLHLCNLLCILHTTTYIYKYLTM